MNYYYADGNNQAIGPITEGQLHLLGRNGSITPDTQVLQEGTTEWCQYGKILASLPDVMFLTSCTHCGASMEVPDPYRGKNIRCSTCQAEFPAFRPDERPFSFDCPECEGSIEAEPSMSGQAAPCPHCRNSIVIPHPASKFPIHAPPLPSRRRLRHQRQVATPRFFIFAVTEKTSKDRCQRTDFSAWLKGKRLIRR